MRRALCLLILLGCGDDSATDSGTDSSTDGGADSGIEYQMHDEIRVEADDGSATLVIAANSLPVGVEASDVRVVAGATSATLELDEGMAMASYELSPNGLRFGEAARLELVIDSSTSPIAILDSDEGVESTAVTVVEEDLVTARFTRVSAEIPHFSSLFFAVAERLATLDVLDGLRDTSVWGITEGPVFVAQPPFPGPLLVGTVYRGDRIVTFTIEPQGMPTARVFTAGTQRVTPIGSSTSETQMVPLQWEPTFRCVMEGTMQAVIVADVTASFRLVLDTTGPGPVHETRQLQADASIGECTATTTDAEGDCVDSDMGACSFFDAAIDIEQVNLRRDADLTTEEVLALFGNTAYPCDEFGGGLRTVCRATPGEFAEGAMWIGTMVLGTDVPDNDPDHSLIYSLVFDSDNVADNDWVPVDPFVWDYFQGTDRWYQLIWNHLTSTWSVTVTQVDASQTQTDVPSAVRVVIVQNAVTFFIPVTELPSATPAYRFSAFAHDGSFSRTDRGGDVNGVDPTVPPQMFVP